MAPGRRKGASKAAAAAAARRQWKVGDLVLAKVKGFPAWPATVSEPEKWGYSSDWKKVLVYFFGTQQIAFCNHADVEPFTEEKKQVLLGKRQGKGADFVRAVQEIIESYEKLKKQEQADDSNSGDVVTLANGVNSNDSSGSKDRADTSESKADIKKSNVIASGNDPSLPTEDTSAAAKIDDLPDKELIPVQPAEEVLVKEKPTLTTYSSRKRSRGSRSEKTVTQQKAPSIQRNRNSSRLESSRFQNSMMPCKDGGKNVGIISSKVTEDGSSRKNKRIRKKTDISQLGDGDSSVSMSNGCSEDHGSEIATVDSDNNSFNEGSTVDSGSNREHLVSGAGCLEGDVELSKSLDFQMKSLVKKKRKPNRKRVTNDSAEPLAGRDVEADFLVEMHYNRQTSQNSGDNLDVQYSKEDGDEHLPLVKRARVRMGKISSADNTSCVARAEENPSSGVAVTSSKQISPSSNFHDGSPAERDFLVAKGDLVNGSPSRVDTQVSGEIPQSWKVSKNQYSCPADGEAALPPSKRLHRALEAMSENAAEEGIACDEPSATLKTPADNGCGTSMQAGCQMDAEEMEARSLEVHGIDLLENAASGFVSRSDPTVMEDPVKSRIEADTGNQLASPENKDPEFCNNDVSNTPDRSGGGNNIESLVDSCTDHHVAQNINSDPLSPNVGVDQAFINGSSNQQLLSKDNNGESADLNNVESVNPDDRPRTSDHIKMSPDPVGLRSDRTSEVPPHDCADVPQHATESTLCMNNESLKSHVDESSIANSMDEVMEDVQRKESLKDRSSSLISNDHLGDKDAMDIQLSPPSTDGVESMARVSPPNTSNGHISTFESSNVVQENGCCSPSVRTCHEKTVCAATAFGERKKESATSDRPRSLNKCNNNAEVHNDLSSFEKQLGTLTRAKESILRATRTAIDCAKFGVSAKVVEILAHHLETETNLKKRIDLFFLVDSITQCSRGLKGDGGIYPSAIQAELPRLLAAAAPAGSIAHDNRRQCLKVLRVWLERKILPESLIRDHIRDIHSLSSRSARTERAFDDPVREMEGMLMDEYGSNSSLQLPGFCMPCMRKDDEESDSDGEGFEAVTPEHYSGSPEEREANSAVEKHRHILEDVDGELEMEDVAPSEIEMSSTCNGTQDQPVKHYEMPIAPPLPQDMPPSSPPPPPSSPPPHPPPPPPSVLPPPCLMSGSYNGVDPNYYNGQDDLRQPVAAPPVPPRVDSKLCSPAVPYQAPPDSRDIHVRNHVSNCNGSYNSYPARPVSNMQPVDGPSFHHQAYPPHPPYHGPPDQFPYGHGDPHMKAQREPPPRSYSNRYDYAPNGDCRHFYSSHDRMKPPPYDRRESWNGHGPNFNGPRYPDRVKASHGPNSYGHPPCEPPRYPNQGWGYPPREMDHRNSFPRRPPPEDAVGSRGPGMWWPR